MNEAKTMRREEGLGPGYVDVCVYVRVCMCAWNDCAAGPI